MHMCEKYLTAKQAGAIVRSFGWHITDIKIYSVFKMELRKVLNQAHRNVYMAYG